MWSEQGSQLGQVRGVHQGDHFVYRLEECIPLGNDQAPFTQNSNEYAFWGKIDLA
jgi:hypothetical protein